ncbi:MAG: 4-alpha-glucanotransferase [Erysipelotrichaceae bacterium]
MEDKLREAGILLPLFSLPGTLGIGDMGSCVFDWLDLLHCSGVASWQILPLHPVGYSNSPYQTYSAFAGDEIYICIEDLFLECGLDCDVDKVVCDSVDYDEVRLIKNKFLRSAYQSFKPDNQYHEFVKNTKWLKEYAIFMALRKTNNYQAWIDWSISEYDHNEVDYQMFLQYIFIKQWIKIKNYANAKDIKIIGDIPIYLSHDSAELYFHKEMFLLNSDNTLKVSAGVPPDYFSKEGQYWGNPIYDWQALKVDNYQLWIDRFKWAQKLFDVIRIDHFRAFDTYWVIDANANSAVNGNWHFGPSYDFFDHIYQKLPNIEIIVEDLGNLRDDVLKLRDHYQLMGMQIIQFTLDPHEIKKDQNMRDNLLLYTGTHDNEVLVDWFKQQSLLKKLKLRWHLWLCGIKDRNLIDKTIHYTLSLRANWAILPLQDITQISNSRINRPGSVGYPNWQWKLKDLDQTKIGLDKLKKWLQQTNRIRSKDK